MLGTFIFAGFTYPPVITNFPIFSDYFVLTDTTSLLIHRFTAILSLKFHLDLNVTHFISLNLDSASTLQFFRKNAEKLAESGSATEFSKSLFEAILKVTCRILVENNKLPIVDTEIKTTVAIDGGCVLIIGIRRRLV
jgi:hypothetical protein